MKDDDQSVIDDAKKFLEICQNADDGSRAEALEDLKFRKGDQWDEQSVRQRELDSRPCLTMNNIPAIIHQVTNDVRQNQQSIHVHPADNDASSEVAEIIEGLCRHIEYDSAADAAYDTALEYAASIGFGYFRLITEYCNPMSFEQDMKIKRIRNPFTVYLDPGAEEADGSDAKRAIISTKVDKDSFKRDYPKADPANTPLQYGTGDNGNNWIEKDFIRVAEFYRVEEKIETLLRLSNGQARLESDKTSPLPPGVYPTGEKRDTVTRKVMWYKLTALEVLEKQEVPFDWIPVFPVYGDEIDIDGKTVRSGIIRYAKDPKRMENYWLTSATEEIALRTKTPFVGALGQFEGVEDDWNSANVRNFSYLEYNPVTIEGNLAPAPQRQPPADVPSGFITMAGIARDAVKAVTGIYDASLGNRSNETSGLAIRARQHQGDIANFHFSDNLSRAIRHLGRVIISGIPRVYDTQRILRIVKPDGTHDKVEVNAPKVEVDPETQQAVEKVANDMTVGEYDCIVTSGPAYNTQREEAAAAMIELGGKWPKLMDVAGDKVVRAFDWPGAADIADRIEKTLPPGLVDDGKEEENMIPGPNGQPIPKEQATQLMTQMQDTLEKMHEELTAMESGEKVKMEQIASNERIAMAKNDNALDVAELNGSVKLLQDKIAPILAHYAAVMAASDPEHPNAPAPIAQGLQQAPGEAEAAQQQADLQPAPDDGNSSAPEQEPAE